MSKAYDNYLRRALELIEAWHKSLWQVDSDGDEQLIDIKLERQLRSIRDKLRAML